MAFPTSPTNGQLATLNGITYQYSSATTSWARVAQSIRITYTAGTTPPSNPLQGDQWYNNTNDVLYEYTNDTVSSYWLDISSSAVVSNSALNVYLANVSNNVGNTANSLILTQETLSVANVLAAGGFANTSNLAYAQANAAFTQANVSFANSNTSIVFLTGVNTAQNTNITSAFTQANLAYNAANSTLGITQNAQAGAYTLQLSDQGKHIYSTTSSNVAFILPNNGTVSWPIGTSILIVLNAASPTTINLQPATGVTMYLAGNSAAPTKTYASIAAYGVASLLNVSANLWYINGAGVT
jgi:hypothetical protein